MDWNRLKRMFPDKENTEETTKKGRRGITDADPSKQRKNFSSRGSFSVIDSHCPKCGHHKALDKREQDTVKSLVCTKCKVRYK